MPSPYEWSTQMESIIHRHVNRLVWEDPRTDMNDGLSLGYPFEIIRKDVLKKGLTDFGYGFKNDRFGNLTPDDVVLLFCYVMMKRHFFACMATFESFAAQLSNRLRSGRSPTVIDFGCGPGTAGFAFADLFPAQKFDYIGIETAAPMRRKALELWNAARKSGLVGNGYHCEFVTSWSGLPFERLASDVPLLVVFSYFFASHSLRMNEIKSLARTVYRLATDCKESPLAMFYLNSPADIANRKYVAFKNELNEMGLKPDMRPPTSLALQFRKKKGGSFSTETIVQQIIVLPRR